MGADPGMLSLVMKFVADAQQFIAENKKAEASGVATTEAIKTAYEKLAAEQQRASDLESKFDAERQKEAKQRTQLVALANEQAAAEKSLADAQALKAREAEKAAQAAEEEKQYTIILNQMLHEQAVRLREVQAAEESRTEVAAVAQMWEEKRAAALAKSEATLAANTTATLTNAGAIKAQELSIRSVLPTLVSLRTLARVTTGVLALGIIVTEWENFTNWIQNAVLAMRGFNDALQQVMASTAQMNERIIGQVKTIDAAEVERLSHITDANERRKELDRYHIEAIHQSLADEDKNIATLQRKLRLLDEIDKATNSIALAPGRALLGGQVLLKKREQDELDHAGALIDIQKERLRLGNELTRHQEEQRTLYNDLLGAEKGLQDADDKLLATGKKKADMWDHQRAVAEEQIMKLQDLNERETDAIRLIEDGELPARRQIILAAERERQVQYEALLKFEEEYRQKKKTLEEYVALAQLISDFSEASYKKEDLLLDAQAIKEGQTSKQRTDREFAAIERRREHVENVQAQFSAAQEHFHEEMAQEEDKARLYALNIQEKYLKHQIEMHGKTAIFYRQETKELEKVEQDKFKVHADAEIKKIRFDEERERERLTKLNKELQDQTGKGALSGPGKAAQQKATDDAIAANKAAAAAKIRQIQKEEADGEKEVAEVYRQAAIDKAMADAKAVEASAARLLGITGHKKAEAYLNMVMATAEGIVKLAEKDYVGAALDFMGAAEYGIIAGQTHGKGGGGGGGGGSTRSESASQKRDSQPGVVMGQSGGAGSGGGSHGYSTTTINVTGGMISADTMQQFAAKFGVGQTGGLYRINANSTSSLPASRA